MSEEVTDIDQVETGLKHVHSFAWISAMTRMISAQLQQPGPLPEFVVEELIETMDPEGGYFTKDHLVFTHRKVVSLNGVRVSPRTLA